MLRHRLLIGGALIPLLIFLLWLDGRAERAGAPAGAILTAGFAAVAAFAAWELAALLRGVGVATRGYTLAVVAALGLLCMQLLGLRDLPDATRLPLLSTAAAATLLLSLLWHVRRREVKGSLLAGAASVFTLVYLGVLPGFWLLVRQEHSAFVVAGAVLVIKSCDIGAYFAGRAFGRRKLIPWLSPGKTWEGLAGGLLVAAGVCVGLAAWANAAGHLGSGLGVGTEIGDDGTRTVGGAMRMPLWYAAVAGAVLAGTGQFGDLVASLLKRDAGVKDSGRTVPGFGGVLDVVDSPIVAAPVAYWLLTAGRALG